MKNIYFNCLLLSILVYFSGCASSNKAPKVDIDEYAFTASYLQLPAFPLDSAYRTFEIDVETGLTSQLGLNRSEIEQRINIEGWKKLDSRAHVQIAARFEDVVILSTEVKEHVDILKDKEGKETGRKSSYYVEITYNFASRATASDYRGQQVGTFVLANREQRRVHNTPSYESAAEARAFLILGMVSLQGKLTRDCISNAIIQLNEQLSDQYGFREMRAYDHLWVLDSRTHPEYEAHRRAWVTFKQVIGSMTCDQPLDEVRREMRPVIDYYNSIKKKYTPNDVRDRRLLYASYYNLAKIYYYLDYPDAAMNEATELVMNDYATRDGYQLEAAAAELKKLLRATGYQTRHMSVRTDSFQGPDTGSSFNQPQR